MSPPRRRLRAALALAAAVAFGFAAGRAGCGARERPAPPAEAGGARAPVAPRGATVDRGSSGETPPAPAAGEVVRLGDGDSLTVLVGRERVEVRLDGVDAPELSQAWGNQARKCASRLALGRRVRLETRGRDSYGRTLADVILPDGRSLNRELVSAGCAWWFRKYAAGDRDLERREAEARSARRGLWGERDPQPPWEFRAARPRRN